VLEVSIDGPRLTFTGSPPAWTPPSADIKLKEDSTDVFRDINAAKYSTYPFEPAVRSLQVMQPNFDHKSVDLVGCGSTLGALLNFAASKPMPFRFDVDVIGETVFFVRRGISPTEIISGLRGYGHTFPEFYMSWDADVRTSCSHQRIVQYTLSGLTILLRSETDGYIRKSDTKKAMARTEKSLEDLIGATYVSSAGPSEIEALRLEKGGTIIPQNSIFDLKTRRGDRTYDINEILPRLWLNQTPNFLLAYHHFGLFNQPKVSCIQKDVLKWEEENAALLSRFHAIIKRIVDVIRDAEAQQCEVSWDGVGYLQISTQLGSGRRALPLDLRSLFEPSE
jgi:hypothetical protein